MTTHIYSEAKLAHHLGIQRKDVKHIRDRKLKKERDWSLHGPRVAYSSAGVARLLRAIKSKPGAFDLAACQCGGVDQKAPVIVQGGGGKAIPVQVKITRICANPGLLQGYDHNSELVNIWVGRNENFTAGMVVPVVPSPDRPGMFRLECYPPKRKYSVDEWGRRQRAGMVG